MAMGAALRLTDVPDDIAADVGHIMVRWARLEWQLLDCLFGLFGFDDVQGRQAFKRLRFGDKWGLLRNMLEARKATVSIDLSKLERDMGAAGERRGWLAHSTWIKLTSGPDYKLEVTAGEWQPPLPGVSGKARKSAKKVPRREVPEHIVVNSRWRSDTLRQIISATERLEALNKELRRL